MSKYHVRWTEAETLIARRLLNRNAHPDDFYRELGKSKKSAQARIRHLDHPRDKKFEERNAIRRRYGALVIPDEVMADAIVRKQAPRSVTSWVLGDPAPGQSALDKREARV